MTESTLTPPTAPTTPSACTTVECPECAGQTALTRRPLNGEVVRCGDCGVELEITCTNPLRVELAPEVREDWGE